MYRLIEVEAAQPQRALTLHADERGIGCLVRSDDRPVAFFMEALPAGAHLTAEEVAALVDRRAGLELAAEALRRRLAAPVPALELDLTVAICTRERPELVERCLDAVLHQEQPGCHVQVLVVDNAPATSGTREVVARHPGVRYAVEPVTGLDVARNRALALATTSWLAYLDDDTVVDRGWLAGVQEAWSENPDAAAITGLVLPLELRTEAQVAFELAGGFRRGAHKRRFGPESAHHSNYPLGAGIFGTGANMAFRVDVLRALGGFDPALDTGRPLPGGGDLDAFYRVVRAGHVLAYEPRAMVRHQHRRSQRDLRRQYWTWGTGYAAFLHKVWRGEPRRRVAVAAMFLWWARREARSIRRSLVGRSRAPLLHAAAPLAGGLLTASWKYPRSQARMRRRLGPGS